MCFSSLNCDCKASAILQLQQSSTKSEARGASGRDVVLGAAQRSSPHGGKMSSSRSPKSAPHASTPAATAAASCAPEPLSCTLLAALATPASGNTPASCSSADPVSAAAAQASSSFNTSSKELESSVDVIAKTSISFSVNPSSAVIISTGLEPSTRTTSSPSKSVGSGSTAEHTNAPLSPSTKTFPHHLPTDTPAHEPQEEKPAGVEEAQSLNCSGGSILVPSVCWEQAGGEVRAALYDLSRSSGAAAAAPASLAFGAFGRAACEETRPPVLGEEQRIGQEEDLVTEQDILMQGDGWGECPAVEGSGEGESPEVGSGCVAAGGGGSLEGSSSSGSNSSSNPLEWSHSIDHLLLDPVGVSAFMAFLREEKGCSNALEFFFACKGLGSQPSEHLRQLLLVIWKKFIRNYNVRVSPQTHADLSEKIYREALSADMFQVAQNEVLENLKQTSYPAFLQSQHYVEQLQQYHADQQKLDLEDPDRGAYQSSLLQQNPVQSITYSPHRYSKPGDDARIGSAGGFRGDYSSNAGPGSKWNPSPGVLTTVYEHETATPHAVPLLSGYMKHLSVSCSVPRAAAEDELACHVSAVSKRPHLSSKILAATAGQRALVSPKQGARGGLNPYHASYGRGHHASRNDSERQSVSSGAYTDDTRSYTDGSIDGDTGYGGSSSKLMRREKMIIKENLRLNEELHKQKYQQQQQQSMLASALGGGAFVVPRTQLSVCPSTNLAKHPEQFAKVLTEKLEAVLRKREGHEKVQRAFKKIQESGGAADVYRREHAVNSLPPSVLMNRIIEKIPLDDDDSGQAILDQHVSRVWQDSSSGSPVCYPSSPPRMMGVCRPPAASLHHHHHHHHSYAPNVTATAGLNTKQKGSSKTPYRSPTFAGIAHQKTAMEQQQQQYPLGVASPYSDYPQTVAPAMPYSKSWHQLRSRDQTSVDVYGAFSSDSGTVPDFCESSGRSGRRHHSGVPKTRSVPEHMMDSCAGSGSERYPSSSGSGSRGRTGGGGSELTDSGVSVISDSRHSLLTATQSSTVHQRVETWLQDTGDSSGRKVGAGGGLTREGDVSLPPSHAPPDDRPLLSSSSAPRRGSCSVASRWSPQQQAGLPDHARRRHRGMTGSSSGAPGDVMRRATTSPAAATRYGGGSVASDSGLTSNGGGLTSSDGGLTSSGGGLTSNGSKATAAAPGSDRNTSSSSGSTMRKAFKPSSSKSTSGGGGGSDGQSSCSRGSDGSSLTESTTVVYSFCDDNVPFVIKIVARSITLKRFKQHLPKRGNYRFFFKKHCEEFGVIQEEMTEDEEVLPLYEGRIFAQIRKAD